MDKLDVDLQMATHELGSYKYDKIHNELFSCKEFFVFRKLLEQLNSSTNGSDDDYEKLKQELLQVRKIKMKIFVKDFL